MQKITQFVGAGLYLVFAIVGILMLAACREYLTRRGLIGLAGVESVPHQGPGVFVDRIGIVLEVPEFNSMSCGGCMLRDQKAGYCEASQRDEAALMAAFGGDCAARRVIYRPALFESKR